MLSSREREWDAEYRAHQRSVVDEEISRAMLRTDAGDAMYRPPAEAQRALADLNISTTTDVLGGFLIPPDTAAYALLAASDEGVLGLRA